MNLIGLELAINIFYLDKNPTKAAEYHVDKHVVKMIQETAQLLSTAHRLLDGVWHKEVLQPAVYRNLSTIGWSGRVDCKALLLPGESIGFDTERGGWLINNKKAMMATHANHPSAIWTRQTLENYSWLYELFQALCVEKLHRYPKGLNQTFALYGQYLSNPPANLQTGVFTEPPPAMPPFYKTKKDDGTYDSVASYRKYYIGDKYRFAKWTNRSIPKWYLAGLTEAWSDDPDERLRVLLTPKVAKKTDITTKHIKKIIPDVYNRVVV